MTESVREEPAALRHRAQYLIDLRRYSAALDVVATGLVQHPADGALLYLGAAASLNMGDLEAGERFAERAVAAAPDWSAPLCCLALAQLKLGQPARAVESVAAAIRLEPNDWSSHALAARICAELPAYRSTGLEAARRAVRLAPGEVEPRLALANIALVSGNVRLAREACDQALRIDPNSPEALNELGRIKLKRKDHLGAAADFAQAAQRDVRLDVAVHNIDVAIWSAVGWLFVRLWVVVIFLGQFTAASGGRLFGVFTLTVLVGLLTWQGVRLSAGLRSGVPRRYLRELPRRDRPLVVAVVFMAIAIAALVVTCLVTGANTRGPWLVTGIVAMFVSRLCLVLGKRRLSRPRGWVRPTAREWVRDLFRYPS